MDCISSVMRTVLVEGVLSLLLLLLLPVPVPVPALMMLLLVLFRLPPPENNAKVADRIEPTGEDDEGLD